MTDGAKQFGGKLPSRYEKIGSQIRENPRSTAQMNGADHSVYVPLVSCEAYVSYDLRMWHIIDCRRSEY